MRINWLCSSNTIDYQIPFYINHSHFRVIKQILLLLNKIFVKVQKLI